MAKGSDDFNVNKLNGGGSLPSYIDGSDAEATAGRIITFYHINSDHYVAFKAFITAFNETYSSDWASEQVYGRNDPIYMFKNTTRKITLSFKVPAATVGESYENLGRVQKLLQFLYPNYSGLRPRDYTPSTESWNDVPGMAHANTISGAPLVRLQVMNLARKRENGQQDKFAPAGTGLPSATETESWGNAPGAAALRRSIERTRRDQLDAMPSLPEDGLLGAIGSVNVNHNLEGEDGVFEQKGGAILPKMIEVTIDFSPIHESHLGWFEDGTFGSDAFPYGAIPDPDYYQAHGYSAAEADQGADAREEGTGGDSLDSAAATGDAPTPADAADENETPPSDASTALAAAAAAGGYTDLGSTDMHGEWTERAREMKLYYQGALAAAGHRDVGGSTMIEIQETVAAEIEREKEAYYGGVGEWEDV